MDSSNNSTDWAEMNVLPDDERFDEQYLEEAHSIIEGLERLKADAHALEDQRGISRSDFRGLDKAIDAAKLMRLARFDGILDMNRERVLGMRSSIALLLYGSDSSEFEKALDAEAAYFATRWNRPRDELMKLFRAEHEFSDRLRREQTMADIKMAV